MIVTSDAAPTPYSSPAATENVNVPACVGVPDTVPSVEIESPLGRLEVSAIYQLRSCVPTLVASSLAL